MNSELSEIEEKVYTKCSLRISNFKREAESQDYFACQFELDDNKVICRKAKITPKKAGQFVTFWKRNEKGLIEPFNETDEFDFFVVTIKSEDRMGQFVFPKSVLIKRGIISTDEKEGKRAFRVYTPWDIVKNKQATKTQEWQSSFFYEITSKTNCEKVLDLFMKK